MKTKKMLTLLVLFCGLVLLQSCGENDSQPAKANPSKVSHKDEIRLLAWNHIQDMNMTETVIIDYKEASIRQTIQDGVDVFNVSFETTQDILLGPIVVVISVDTEEVLGIMPRF